MALQVLKATTEPIHHVDFHGRGKEVQLFYDSGQAVLYSPDTKFYTTIASPKTIEATLEALQKKDVFIPVRNFLEKYN